MRKILCLFLSVAILLACPILSVAEQPAATFTMAGFDGDDSTHDWNTNKFFKLMEQKTGVSFTFSEFTNYDAWQREKARMFEKDELPDVFFKAELNSEELIRYTDSGQIIDLKPLLPEHAPNLWKLLTENPEWLAAITLPSGKIGALPKISTLKTQNAMWINKKWLDELGLDMPTDAESFYRVLKAFKSDDPNRNGKQDEIPVTFMGIWDLKFLGHAFGLIANDYNISVDEGGNVKLLPFEDSFYDFMEYLKKLYSEGLLLKNGFYTADALRIINDENATVTYGVMLAPTAMTYMHFSKSEQYALLPAMEYSGKRIYRDLIGNITRGTFAITKNCQDPAKLLNWVDTLYTEEGGRLTLGGEEGVDYAFNEDGTWKYIEDTSILAYTIDSIVLYTTGNMPWLYPVDFESRYALDSMNEYNAMVNTLNEFVKEPFPTSYTLTLEQRDYIKPLQDAIGYKIDMWMSEAVMGDIELTRESYESFIGELRELGADEFIRFWQDVYDSLEK